MNKKTQSIINNLTPSNLRALEISGDYWNQTKFKSYKNVFYPEFDICDSILEEKFDLIIAEQVFEHLIRPYQAGKNVYEMLNQGGYFLITTPFLIRVHNFPHDCSRWTETGIKYLLNEFGFEINNIHTGSWGNKACIKGNFKTWKLFNPLFHSLKNELEFPVVVWALSKK